MTLLLYFGAFGSLFALFASLIGLIGWILIKLYRAMSEPAPEPTRQTGSSQDGWNPNQWKRAGQ
jgi:hypothetical protein